ncbi:23S rRNA accumulation protein YceD [Aestuariibacter salexigens]|uniref:23S rRNA accumulation protein YceD n=1 Tax=Aestuariibacter salexigens TaxID=226010 RepID=UPI00042373F4|nr:23S rRNA accumulation protein YceD [Aestuariibacter salexigens]
MQKVKLPKSIDPVKSALKRSEYRGVMMSSDMARLLDAVAGVADNVEIEVKFAKDAQGLTYFDGSLATSVSLVCQRCNELFEQPLEVEFCFTPVQGSEQIEQDLLPDAYDPVEVDEYGEINLLQLFEDELILALPIVALHAEEDCKVSAEEMQFGQLTPEQERPNPFAVLKELKRDQE